MKYSIYKQHRKPKGLSKVLWIVVCLILGGIVGSILAMEAIEKDMVHVPDVFQGE